MAGRIIAALCIVAFAGCAGSPGEPTGPSPDALASRGYDAYNRADYSGAVAYFEETLALDPKNAFALRGLAASRDGGLYFGDSEPETRETDDAIYRVSLQAREAYGRGDLTGAASRFQAVLAVDPGNAYAREALETIRLKRTEREAIEEAVASTVVISPPAIATEDGESLAIGSDATPDDGGEGIGTEDGALLAWRGRSSEEAIEGWRIRSDR